MHWKNTECTSLSRMQLAEFKTHREAVANHDDPDGLPAISKPFGIMKLLEHFPTYLESKLGANNIALAYVIRDDAEPPMPLPGLAHGKPWSVSNGSISEELVNYARHDSLAYQMDNATVYRVLQEVLAGTQHILPNPSKDSKMEKMHTKH